jgi:magnesium-transporting ATPase (P-type)
MHKRKNNYYNFSALLSCMKRIFNLPRLVRWILSVGCIFLIVMTLMRLGLYFYFNKQGYSFSNLSDAFILGFRYDLRSAALILLIILILGSITPLHPFHSSFAKKIWIVLLGIIVFIVLFFYVIDFAHYSYLNQRLNASVLNYTQYG